MLSSPTKFSKKNNNNNIAQCIAVIYVVLVKHSGTKKTIALALNNVNINVNKDKNLDQLNVTFVELSVQNDTYVS